MFWPFKLALMLIFWHFLARWLFWLLCPKFVQFFFQFFWSPCLIFETIGASWWVPSFCQWRHCDTIIQFYKNAFVIVTLEHLIGSLPYLVRPDKPLYNSLVRLYSLKNILGTNILPHFTPTTEKKFYNIETGSWFHRHFVCMTYNTDKRSCNSDHCNTNLLIKPKKLFRKTFHHILQQLQKKVL